MKIQTSELTRAALDWAVAKCEGYQAVYTNGALRPVFRKCETVEATWPNYSTDWSQGGPIIEREKIDLQHIRHADLSVTWDATIDSGESEEVCGDTPLIAAMRCYVASKLGDEVEVPDDLTR